MRGIRFKTVAATGVAPAGEGRCRCNTIHSDVLDAEDIAADMAAKMRISEFDAQYYTSIVCNYIVKALGEGKKLNFREFSLSLSIRGTVVGANGKFVRGRNSVGVNIQAGRALRKALDEIDAVNATAEELPEPRIANIHDMASNEDFAITPGGIVYVSGADIRTPAESPDEGVWIEKPETGERVARGVVTASTTTTLDCVFAETPPPGDYAFALWTRPPAYKGRNAPAVARRRIRVLSG